MAVIVLAAVGGEAGTASFGVVGRGTRHSDSRFVEVTVMNTNETDKSGGGTV